MSGSSSRLSLNTYPTHYDLTIKTDLRKKCFEGKSTIHLTVSKSTPSIILNVASPLVLNYASLSNSTSPGSIRKAVEFKYDLKKERVEILFESGVVIEVGEYVLGLRWEGSLNRSMKGYYLSSYPTKEVEGQESFYALTQFQPTSARRAFPCFDDPSMKASYSISMISRVGTVSLSNMYSISTFPSNGELLSEDSFDDSLLPLSEGTNITPTRTSESTSTKTTETSKTETSTDTTSTTTTTTTTKSTSTTTSTKTSTVKNSTTLPAARAARLEENEWELVSFAKSPLISTYLVIYANGYFEYNSSSYVSPLTNLTIPLRFYATYDVISQTQLALDTTAKLMPLYEKMFDLPFPLPKLDTLVVSDFDLGAMENWGLITGRTSVYLWEEKSGIAAKKRVVSTTSHELSHQWFGNLVTMKFWNELYLNESFATVVGEGIVLNQTEPTWKPYSTFISDHLGRALSLDSLRSSHPIEVSEDITEDQILSVFDAVSYSKGGSVLKMLFSLVSEKVFLKGVTNYLKAHIYSNASSDDLWKGITEACSDDGNPRNISGMMDSWTKKIGFPLITVDEDEEGIVVSQNRFLSTNDVKPEEDETIWHVPLEILRSTSSGKSIDHTLLTTRKAHIKIDNISKTTFKLNAETNGVYRVLYTKERLSKLGDEAGKLDSAFSINDKMGLIQDVSVLASSGYTRTSSSLSLILKLSNETETLVFAEISSALGSLVATWSDQLVVDRDGLDKLRLSLFKPLVEKLGFEYVDGEDIEKAELRTMAISIAANCGDKETLTEYKKRFDLLLEYNNDSGIPSDLRRSIFSRSVEYGGEAEYLKILEIYRAAPSPSHKISAIAGLSSAQSPELLKKTFELVLSSEVKNQDFVIFFNYLAMNSAAKKDLWTLFKSNYDSIITRFSGNFVIGRIIVASFSSIVSEEHLKDVKEFFGSKSDTAGYLPSLEQGMDSLASDIAWINRDVEDVHTWLKNNGFIA